VGVASALSIMWMCVFVYVCVCCMCFRVCACVMCAYVDAYVCACVCVHGKKAGLLGEHTELPPPKICNKVVTDQGVA
jgi:hypothetical protein